MAKRIGGRRTMRFTTHRAVRRARRQMRRRTVIVGGFVRLVAAGTASANKLCQQDA